MSNLELRAVQRWAQVIVWGIVTCLMLLVFIAGLQTYRQVFRPPPFEFGQEAYLPLNAAICPGDTLDWQYKLHVRRAPTVLAVALTLWDVNKQTNIVPDKELDFLIWTSEEEGETLTRPAQFALPAKLPVGIYEVRGAATAFNSDAAAYRVPFVIPESCFKRKP